MIFSDLVNVFVNLVIFAGDGFLLGGTLPGVDIRLGNAHETVASGLPFVKDAMCPYFVSFALNVCIVLLKSL